MNQAHLVPLEKVKALIEEISEEVLDYKQDPPIVYLRDFTNDMLLGANGRAVKVSILKEVLRRLGGV